MEATLVYATSDADLLTIGNRAPVERVFKRLEIEFGKQRIRHYFMTVETYVDKKDVEPEDEVYHALRFYLLYKTRAPDLDLQEELTYLTRCQLLRIMSDQNPDEQDVVQLARQEYNARYSY